MARSWESKEFEVTDQSTYLNRRKFLQAASMLPIAAHIPLGYGADGVLKTPQSKIYADRAPQWLAQQVAGAQTSKWVAKDDVTPYEHIIRYNNFYEFGSGKSDPYDNAQDFKSDPWSVEIKGEADVKGKFTLEDILKPHPLEERIYRLRCVEAWSMVVPWIGFPLSDLLKRFKPTSKAKFVRFTTLVDSKQMPGQRAVFKSIDYPYVEGLRIDEAMNELAFVAVGLYGGVMQPQNGAPLRLVLPWKYGFKSIKSIVSIEFLERQPRTTWEKTNAREYGFYANVNPEVSHPRWSQASERRLPGSLFSPNRMDTQKFNGYEEQVAQLYANMDLNRYY